MVLVKAIRVLVRKSRQLLNRTEPGSAFLASNLQRWSWMIKSYDSAAGLGLEHDLVMIQIEGNRRFSDRRRGRGRFGRIRDGFAYPQLRPGDDEPPGPTTGKNSS
jgi:hypothetical protein